MVGKQPFRFCAAHLYGFRSITVNELAQQAAADEVAAQGMVTRLEPYEKTYKNLLDVLGTAPAKDAPAEPASITRQRQLIDLKMWRQPAP